MSLKFNVVKIPKMAKTGVRVDFKLSEIAVSRWCKWKTTQCCFLLCDLCAEFNSGV